jgi:hypothetical protein
MDINQVINLLLLLKKAGLSGMIQQVSALMVITSPGCTVNQIHTMILEYGVTSSSKAIRNTLDYLVERGAIVCINPGRKRQPSEAKKYYPSGLLKELMLGEK